MGFYADEVGALQSRRARHLLYPDMLYMPKVFSQMCAPFGHAQVACSILVTEPDLVDCVG
jgi:hypothetical protein